MKWFQSALGRTKKRMEIIWKRMMTSPGPLYHHGAPVIKGVVSVQRSPDEWKGWNLGTDHRIYKTKYMMKDTPPPTHTQ